ncbi:MAG TPA: aminoglycoside phosphotransferase family protein [Pyrinomonadaceae bacterium]|nr:aminoglycoside phosphotransferase family protein [Pyrinomonadaceae bacterium]
MINTPSILTAEDFERHFSADFWHDFAVAICRRHNLSFQNLERTNGTEHIVFFADDALVIKIYTPFRGGFHREKAGLEFARNKTSLTVPEILFEGEIENFNYLVLTRLEGVLMTREIWLKLETRKQIEVVRQLSIGLKELHARDAGTINFDWRKFVERQAAAVVDRQKANGANPEWLERLPGYLEESLPLLPAGSADVFLHGDVHFGNLRLLETRGKWRISGLFDFADSLRGFHEYDFLAVGVLMIQGQGELQREFFRAYGYGDGEINEILRRRLMLLTVLYECSNLRKYALRLRPEAVDLSLDELERAIWNFCGN